MICVLVSVAFAQRQKDIVKIGCVDIQRVIDVVSADSFLKKILADKQAEYLKKAEDLAKEIHKLKEILEKEENTLDQNRLDSIREDIIFKEEQLKEFLNQKSALLKQREDVLSYKVLKNLYQFVKQVAIENGYSMIIEKNTAVIYVNPDIDVTDKVLKSLEKEKEKFKLE